VRVLEFIHDAELEVHGGLAGIRSEAALDAAINAPMSRWLYQPDDSSLEKLAAVLALRLMTAHAFNDANKRTAAVSIAAFLSVNGLRWKPKRGALQHKMVEIAKQSQSTGFNEEDCLDGLALWIQMSTQEQAKQPKPMG